MLLTKLIPQHSESLKDAVACFNRFLEEPHENKEQKCEMFIYGGRACLKSSIASGMVLKAMVETGQNAMCIRKQACDLRESCFSQMAWVAREFQIKDKMSFEKSRMETGNNARILFFGLDGPGAKLNSAAVHLRPKVMWIEEADELERRDYEFISKELHLAENPIIISTFNTPAQKSHWLNKKIEEHLRHNGMNGFHDEWFFNPCFTEIGRDWLGESFFISAERMRRMNPIAFCREYIGVPFED